MFALLAALLFILAAFGVSNDDINLVWLALASLSVHFAFDWTPWPATRGRTTP